ncbi:DNA-methyltransferase [Phytohabitans rumicis]|uniref:Methyltransferase n=1 Tax=Phytohabitans rumicis TaxID=1076125 RepID=A0A6V8LEW0_9ACTN|nr:site-specific DNA-methyltransferase [Phytohabitans rumicis]GFJ93361.1 methyltransferase [Phytohabitans rumicis]
MTRTALAAPEPADRFLYHRDGPVTLYLGDAHRVLTALPTASVDTVVTSPPYYGLRNYDVPGQYGLEPTPQTYVDTMVRVFTEVHRVLRDHGTVWLVLGDSYSLNSGGAPRSGTYNGYRGAATTRPGLIRPRTQDLLPAKNLIGIPWRVAFALQDTRLWYLRQAIVWHKPNATPESVRDRPSCSHEYVFLLAKSRFYYFNLDAIRVPLARPDALDGTRIIGGRNKGHTGGIGATARRRGATAHGAHPKYTTDPGVHRSPGSRRNLLATGTQHTTAHPGGRNPGSVWSIPTRPYRGAHFAVYPLDLPDRAVAAGCPPEGLVLDPFSGAATTGVAALRQGRQYWGIDIKADYHDIAIERLSPHQQSAPEPR